MITIIIVHQSRKTVGPKNCKTFHVSYLTYANNDKCSSSVKDAECCDTEYFTVKEECEWKAE